MIQRKPDITDEDIGMRAFKLRKERAAERAIEKIRQKLGPKWASLTVAETELLNWLLGEVWAYIARKEWDEIPFSLATFSDVKKLIEIGSKIVTHEYIGTEGLEKAYKILKKR